MFWLSEPIALSPSHPANRAQPAQPNPSTSSTRLVARLLVRHQFTGQAERCRDVLCGSEPKSVRREQQLLGEGRPALPTWHRNRLDHLLVVDLPGADIPQRVSEPDSDTEKGEFSGPLLGMATRSPTVSCVRLQIRARRVVVQQVLVGQSAGDTRAESQDSSEDSCGAARVFLKCLRRKIGGDRAAGLLVTRGCFFLWLSVFSSGAGASSRRPSIGDLECRFLG